MGMGRGGVLVSTLGVVLRPLALASLHFTDQVDIEGVGGRVKDDAMPDVETLTDADDEIVDLRTRPKFRRVRQKKICWSFVSFGRGWPFRAPGGYWETLY